MFKIKPVAVALTMAIGAYAPSSQANEGYFSRVGDKFMTGFANIFTRLGEVPKNIADASSKTNYLTGAAGGLVYGTIHTLGRTASGVFDVITSPIPTESMVEPKYVWSDFSQPTTYGGTFGIETKASTQQDEETYLGQVGDKFMAGFTNIFTGLIEVPKNIAYATEKTNGVVGLVGGFLNGTAHTFGRTASGIFDVITSPIPTESMVEPRYVWSDFNQPTSYGGTFKASQTHTLEIIESH